MQPRIYAAMPTFLGFPRPPTSKPSQSLEGGANAVACPTSACVAIPVSVSRRPRGALTVSRWRQIVVDTGVQFYVEHRSTIARFEVYAAAIDMPITEYMEHVKARYATLLKRDEYGDRPVEVHVFATWLDGTISRYPTAVERLRELRKLGDEVERRAAIARRRKKVDETIATAKGLAAILAAAALVGKVIDPTTPPPGSGAPDASDGSAT